MDTERESTQEEKPLAEAVLDLLERSGQALSIRELARSLKVQKKRRPELDRAVSSLLADGRIHPWPGNLLALTVFLDSMTEEVLSLLRAKSPLPRLTLRAKLPRPARPVLDAILAPLVASGKVFEHPKAKGRPLAVGLAPPDPLDYLEPALHRVVAPFLELFGKEGVAEAFVRFGAILTAGKEPGPSRQKPAPDQLIRFLGEVNPQVSGGALVFIRDWREAARPLCPDKKAFDEAVLALAEDGTIQLQSHDRPSDLTDEEREGLIPNGRGSYFIAAGLRM